MASTISVDVTASALTSDEQMLSEVQAAIRAVLARGQSYTLFGSRSVTSANLPELQKLELLYRRRVLLARGHTGRNVADFSGEDSGNCLDNVPDQV